MKAAVMPAPGTTPGYGDFDEPEEAEGREIVELVAAGIHPVVRSLAEGRHYGSTGRWPLIPGVDAVARTADGALVYTGYVEAPYGTLAERMAVPAGMRLPLPDGADPVAVAGGLNPGLASWMPLRSRAAEAGALGTVVVLGATGMAGLLAVQNAFLLGAARVVGAGRNPAGLDRAAAAGATTVALTGDPEADAAQLAGALGGGSPGLVLDFVWAGPAEAMFRALGGHGLGEDRADIAYVQIGALAGPEASVPSSLLRSRRIKISGSGAGSASVAAIIDQLPVYMRLIADGRVHVPTRTFPLPRVADAWTAARGGGPRVVVTPD
ncbi:MAG TPA: zinc-binding alcohol dehydrogenase family protein [Streptosporangiaceae bacterium]|nr:zinc-binding alcohol dehydrogenase family protein [Streptosporangiaceae bacterium]